MKEDDLLSRRRARSEVETAVKLKELPNTADGFEERSDLLRQRPDQHQSAAARHGPSCLRSIELADIAKTQSPDNFAGTVRKHQQQRSQDDGLSQLEHQRSQRYVKISTDLTDGMTVLYGRFDPITGARIESVLSKKVNELWREENPQARSTREQRIADALEIFLTRPENNSGGRSQEARLLLIAQHEAITGKLGQVRLPDGTPIPLQKLREIACEAEVLPAIFQGASQPLDLGRARRVASPAQRILW